MQTLADLCAADELLAPTAHLVDTTDADSGVLALESEPVDPRLRRAQP